MGRGIMFTCVECGASNTAEIGFGYMYPIEYEEVKNEIIAGKYGDEWKKLYQQNENVAVDAEVYVYSCRKCGHWLLEPGLSLFVPKQGTEVDPD